MNRLDSSAKFVCLLDILGFREMIERNPLAQVADAIRLVKRVADESTTAATQSLMAWKMSPTPCRHVTYSDSILVYAEGQKDEDLASLVYMVGRMVAKLLKEGVFVRGAIVGGELLVVEDADVYIGRALVRAYSLEQRQKWAGVVLAPETTQLAQERRLLAPLVKAGLLMEYEVPWNSNPSPRRFHCVGWPGHLEVNLRSLQESALRLLPTPTDDGLAIQAETWQFAKAYGREYSLRLEA